MFSSFHTPRFKFALPSLRVVDDASRINGFPPGWSAAMAIPKTRDLVSYSTWTKGKRKSKTLCHSLVLKTFVDIRTVGNAFLTAALPTDT